MGHRGRPTKSWIFVFVAVGLTLLCERAAMCLVTAQPDYSGSRALPCRAKKRNVQVRAREFSDPDANAAAETTKSRVTKMAFETLLRKFKSKRPGEHFKVGSVIQFIDKNLNELRYGLVDRVEADGAQAYVQLQMVCLFSWRLSTLSGRLFQMTTSRRRR
eukprot:TRINITY_DN122026_c0_g1_i1.p1 TRINITY_DN122026_c0_g1~~TRINITY_DN122026_c0_g1_i1.p1  ORF type:complete len:160 (+),score=18.73 TRINITY_DN122026_c0_g1_i1:58-537(+)